MMLSPNFSLTEMTKSETAARRGGSNDPPPAACSALVTLCKLVLEPVRAHFGRPVTVNSGYRSPQVNRAVGSSAGSQHVLGEAADIEIPGIANGALATFIMDHIAFDQLILEAYTPGRPASGWVHVSYRQGRLRHDVLTATPRPGQSMAYAAGLRL